MTLLTKSGCVSINRICPSVNSITNEVELRTCFHLAPGTCGKFMFFARSSCVTASYLPSRVFSISRKAFAS